MSNARKSRYLTVEEKKNILQGLENGVSTSVLSKMFGISTKTIRKVKQDKHRLRACCGGRPSSTTKLDDDNIRMEFKKNCFKPIRVIQREFLTQYSRSLLQRRMKKFGFTQRATVKKPFLTSKQKATRLAFAREYADRPRSFWRSVYFADECLVKLQPWTLHPKVIYSPRFGGSTTRVVETIAHPKQLHCWFAIKHAEPVKWSVIHGNMDSEKFVDIIRERFALNIRPRVTGRTIIIQDNAPCHVAKQVRV